LKYNAAEVENERQRLCLDSNCKNSQTEPRQHVWKLTQANNGQVLNVAYCY